MEGAGARQPVKEQAVKVGVQDAAESLQELYDMISRRAYELFEVRGCEHGHDLEDWLRAEAELLQPVPVKIHHTVNRVTVRAELPGFRADQIRVSVEPSRVILIGKNQSSENDKTEGRTFTRGCAEHVFQVLNLPAEIHPSKVTAVLKGEVLEVVLPKVEKFEANLKLKAA